jgi:hypothetical protein
MTVKLENVIILMEYSMSNGSGAQREETRGDVKNEETPRLYLTFPAPFSQYLPPFSHKPVETPCTNYYAGLSSCFAFAFMVYMSMGWSQPRPGQTISFHNARILLMRKCKDQGA